MINLPVLQSLDVGGYGMYPGSPDGEPGLHVVFQPGLTVVLGANGLGKTTLINILYRLLVGPYHIRGITGRTDLGSTNLVPTQSPSDRTVFRNRVSDGAEFATARVQLLLGPHEVLIERNLSDLRLTRFDVAGEHKSVDEDTFQLTTAKLANVWTFGDWMLLLQYLVFYFEDRRSLVWDAAAQRQILRALLLDPGRAEQWSKDERRILELDSQSRNLSAVITTEERALPVPASTGAEGLDVKAELALLIQLQELDVAEQEMISDDLAELDAQRQKDRLRKLRADLEHDTCQRDVERAKLTAIQARFPEQSETARYILAHLISSDTCLVCGNEAASAAAELEARINGGRCVVCETQLSASHEGATDDVSVLADRRVAAARIKLEAVEADLDAARAQLRKSEVQYARATVRIAELMASVGSRKVRIDELSALLPPSEELLASRRNTLANLRGRLAILREELSQRRNTFSKDIEAVRRDTVFHSEAIRSAFAFYAEGFLIEGCDLTWSPQFSRVGQTGEPIEFPGFEVDLTGVDFALPVRRSSPEQVSESQREFIDLAFRMALMEVGGYRSQSTLVIDAPESSLDAVFMRRAARVLGRFAEPYRDNRLVMTSNLTEGALLPDLLSLSMMGDGHLDDRLVDLFELAAPTAAIRELRTEYDSAKARLMEDIASAAGKPNGLSTEMGTGKN